MPALTSPQLIAFDEKFATHFNNGLILRANIFKLWGRRPHDWSIWECQLLRLGFYFDLFNPSTKILHKNHKFNLFYLFYQIWKLIISDLGHNLEWAARGNRTRDLRFTSSQTSCPPLTHCVHYRSNHWHLQSWSYMIVRPYPARLHPGLHPNLSLSESHHGYPLYR